MLNGSPLNGHALNASADVFVDWSIYAPIERITVYLLDVDGVRIPMSSFQATMRGSDGKSYLQAVIPNGVEYLNELPSGAIMRILMGFKYPDNSYSPLEEIAQAPLEILRYDEGARSNSVTISGYSALPAATGIERQLTGISYRSVNQGKRRVRCNIDLFLRPGHTAIDGDGEAFSVANIQYFVNDKSEYMEVLQGG